MEVFEIHGPCKIYWNEEGSDLFPAMNLGKIMSCTRFQEIARFLQLSFDQNHDQQILKVMEAVNCQFQACLTPGSYVTLDESMTKSFHRNLKGKIKIIQKPRPGGNKIKNLMNRATNIALNMELFEGKDNGPCGACQAIWSNSNSDPAHLTISQYGKKSYC